ncbi:hypothetical protein CWC05_22185, partial [Pseudoalteromonas ruthenica]
MKTCVKSSITWVDARLNLFESKPEGLINMMLDYGLRDSWQILDKYLKKRAEQWELLYITQSHLSWKTSNQLG